MKAYSGIFFRIFFTLSLTTLFSCNDNSIDYNQHVNHFIGSATDGNTFPGASYPFGAVQLSPDTRIDPTAHKAYGYADSIIYGFSHTHLNGVGEPEYKDILFMPFAGKVSSKEPEPGNFASPFNHDQERAEPGYYSVLLENKIKVELTATLRCGFHKYTFPEGAQQNLYIDLTYPSGAEELYIRKVSDNEIEGLRRSHGWAYNQYVYFVTQFSKPIKEINLSENGKKLQKLNSANAKSLNAILTFDNSGGEELLVTTGLSAVDAEGARKNLNKEIAGFDFEKIRQKVYNEWNRELGRISIEGGTKEQQSIFYTAMYHSFLSPDIFEDVDGRYRGIDGKIHKAKGFTNYTVFSIWDTYRALHPLFTIINQQKNIEFIKSLHAKYDDGGRLPMWPLAGNYTDDMLGYHVVSIIADAYVKGLIDFDAEKALKAMTEIANMDRLGLKYYKELGYIPFDRQGESVSKTLEYCYNDWCIAQMAKSMNKEDDYTIFHQRAHYYENVFDTTTNLFRGKDINRNWLTPFNPLKNSAYSEGNAYQYLYVPHDIEGLIRLMGGDDVFANMLDTIFTKSIKDKIGSIGQYWHGNEPSHHLAYLYNYAGQPWKTQKLTNRILNELYKNSPDGIAGNDDCGQISAWYVLSSMGFYPVSPGQDIYVIGTPLFNKATINLENGKTFTIKANGRSVENYYIQSATLNGKDHTKSYIKHSDIVNGGELIFEMASTPNKNWGSAKNDRPYSENGKEVVRIPFVKSGERLFKNSTIVNLGCDTKGAKIFYTLDGSEPDKNSPVYTRPFVINKTSVLKMRSYDENLGFSITIPVKFEKAEYATASGLNNPSPGLKYKYFERFFVTSEDLDKEDPVETGIINNFTIADAHSKNYFGYIFEGYIKVPHSDIYTFYLLSNDGSRMYINGKEIIENDGNHGSIEEEGKIALKAGFHKIKINYMQCGGGKSLKVSWENSKFKKKEIDRNVLFNTN